MENCYCGTFRGAPKEESNRTKQEFLSRFLEAEIILRQETVIRKCIGPAML